MRDPHVEWLRYRLETAPSVSYTQPPPLDIDYREFSGRLEEGILTSQMKEHYSSIVAARQVVDPYLRAWELDVALEFGRGEIRFIFEDGKVIDRNPPPPGQPLQIQKHDAILSMNGALVASLQITKKEYPNPPMAFRISPDVETLWHRYEMYLDGKEPLLSMAYFCLTLLETRGDPGGRKGASSLFNIDIPVLKKLGELTTNRMDGAIARKVQLSQIPLTGSERKWIEATIKKIIHRVGEINSGNPLPEIKMEDLPPLA